MKKNIKLVLALVLSIMMVLGSVALAADADPAGRTGGAPLTNKSITLNNPTAGHTYKLYQVFTGTYASVEGKDTLGNIKWGRGVTDDGKTAMYTKYNANPQTPEKVAEAIGTTAAEAQAFAIAIDAYLTDGSAQTAGSEAPITALVWGNLSEGYYIIKDETTLGSDDAADAVVVQVLDSVSITAKGGTTGFDKKVKDRNDSTQKPSVYDAWGNTSDYDVGDDVPYEITITLPANYTSYEKYVATVNDKMGDGLSFNSSSVTVTIDGKTYPSGGYEVKTTGLTDKTFEIVFSDMVALDKANDTLTINNGSVIKINYTAKLTGTNVVYGNPGNPNEAWLTYSNNPTKDTTGESTHKTTVTFTYKFEVDKTDGTKPLAGAEFKLEKQILAEDGSKSWKDLGITKGTEGTIFTYDGLDDGFYRITETVTPAGYNSIDPIYFTVEAVHTETLDSLVVKQANDQGTALDTSAVTATFNVTLTKTDKKAAGLIDTEVVNNQGATLPETGGVGTTLFYVGGSILVLAAAILLITKRRMGAND